MGNNGVLEAWGLQSPDELGTSEYRAIYETLADGLSEESENPAGLALAMLDEFVGHAKALQQEIRQATTTEGPSASWNPYPGDLTAEG
jgi:hypothetical protein